MEEAGPEWSMGHINNALLEEKEGKLQDDEFKKVVSLLIFSKVIVWYASISLMKLRVS